MTTDDDEWEYLELTYEQTNTLWKDVTLWCKDIHGERYASINQAEGKAPGASTYYLRVKKEDTDGGGAGETD